MATLQVDTLQFHFQSEIDARKYDDSQHYRNVLRPNGARAVDVTAVEWGAHPQRSWLIEAKDYRILHGQPKDSLPSEMAEDMFRKVTGTQHGLADAAVNASDPEEKVHAARMLQAATSQIVFHLEPYAGPASKLFPRDPTASVLQKMKQLFGPTNTPILVLSIKTTRAAKVPWTVS